MLVKDVVQIIEDFAPPSLQESYDNSGLLVGSPNMPVKGVLLCLDCTEAVVAEAIANGCNLIVAHHPIVFSGLKRLNGSNYIERTVISAIKHEVAIYACHTNLDNVAAGVNAKIAEKLGLENAHILQPKKGVLKKLVTFVPAEHANAVRDALFIAGAGQIGNYTETSYNLDGTGTFKANDGSNPYTGQLGTRHYEEEVRIETIFAANLQSKIIRHLLQAHPYEEVAYDILPLDNAHPYIGSGMVGELPEAMDETAFLQLLKTKMNAPVVRHTPLLGKPVKKLAWCGGSGSFLLNDSIRQGVDLFITADFKYHQFFDADGRIVIADIGHFETEQYTPEIFHSLLTKKISNFAILLSTINTNPVNYF